MATMTGINYLFQSERLGFRSWVDSDLEPMAGINLDPEVMQFFPGLVDAEGTRAFINRMQAHEAAHSYCYFAVDELISGNFIGFIGLMQQSYPAPFTPCVDIGWRLGRKYWMQGYATEGAKACLQQAFHQFGLTEVYSIAPAVNHASIQVMIKAGMEFHSEFEHPLLQSASTLKDCVVYKIKTDNEFYKYNKLITIP